jgi:hypothetical protein
MAIGKQLSDNNPTGTVLGQSATDLIAFHGSTGTDQYAAIADLSINALSVSGVIGFTSSASFSTVITALNSVLAMLREKGLIAT